ncbi:MAG: hypothetical protein ACR2GN_04940 [Bacteroidia bacterium]
MNNKVLFGGLAAGVAFFLLGWLLYGTLLVDFMASHAGSATGVMKEGMPDFLWLIIGNLSMGLFLALACSWAGATQASSGALIGFWVGLLVGIGIDGIMLGTSNLMTPMGMVIDVIVFTTMCVISGAVAGMVLGMSGRTATA